MPRIRFDPVTDLDPGPVRQKNVRNYHIGRETVQNRKHLHPISGKLNIKALFAKDSSTNALGMRAVIGQKDARDQFFFFFGSFGFFTFLGSTAVPLAMIGAFASAAA